MPLDLEELNGLYGQGPGPKPKIVPPKQQEAFDLSTLDKQPESPISIGGARPTDVEDYGKYLDQGVYSDQDIDSQRGQHQSVINKVGHALGNLPLNIVGTMVEGIGDLGLLAGQWGDDRTYTNALIEAGKAMHNVTGEIYMRNQHNTLGATLSDPSWWIDQVEGLAEFGVSYAALGAGIGGSLSKIAEAGATAFKAGQVGTQAGRMLGQLGTAGYMAYTMGASNAGEVFKSTYDYQFKKMINQGLEPEEASTNAKHIAAQSAATTAQLTTAIGTVLALGSMGAYFRKSSDAAIDILKKTAPMLPGETMEAWAGRVKNLDPDAYKSLLVPNKAWGHKLAEMGKMGVEMQQLQFGHKTGEELGREGKVRGFMDQFGELENYLDRTMDKDGGLAFAIGALSGLGIDHLREKVIPSRWADQIDKTTGEPIPKTDEEGNIVGVQRKLYTPRALSEMHSVNKFNTMKEAIASDIEEFDKGSQAYLAAIKSGNTVDAQTKRDQLFNQHNVAAIIHGTGDMWKKTYEEIAELSPEEATQRGYATRPEDISYQEAAQKAASNIEQYQKMYDKLQTRYGTYYEQNQGFKPVTDGIFSRQVHLDAWEKGLQEHRNRFENMKLEEEKDLRELYPGDPLIGLEADKVRNLYSATQTFRSLNKEHKALGTAIEKNDSAGMSAFVREYMGIDQSGDMDIVKAAKAVHKNIEWAMGHEKTDMQKHKDSINVPEGKSFNEHVQELLENIHSADYQHQIWQSETKLEQAKKNLAEVVKEKNLIRMANKYSKYMDQLVREADKMDAAHDKEMARRAKNQDSFADKTREQLDAVAERYRQAHEKHVKEFNDEAKQHDRLRSEYDTLKSEGRDWLRRRALKSQLNHLERIMKGRAELINKYQAGYEKYKTPTDPSISQDVVDTTAITTNAPEGSQLAPNVAIPDPQFEAVQEQVEVLQPDADTMQQEENKLLAVEKEYQQTELEQTEGKLIDNLSNYYDYKETADRLSQVQADALSGVVAVSYQIFSKEIADGKMTQEQAVSLAKDMNDYIRAVKESESSIDDREYNAQAMVYEPLNGIDTTDIEISEDPEILFADETNAMSYSIPSDDGQGGVTFAGAKTVDAATIANSTLGYFEFSPNHNKEIELVSQKDQVNMKTNPDVLKPGKLMPGTSIRFEVDTEYDGPKNIVGQLKQDEYGNVPQGHETFQDYSDANGKVPKDKMGNVPIKIVDDATGKTIGYVRKHEWVAERYGKESGLRNIAERFDQDGNEINGPEQSKKILDIRKAIIDRYNETGLHTTGKTSSKGVGHPILNMEVKNKTSKERASAKPGYAFNKKDGGLLPDPKLEIVIVNNGTLMSGKGHPTLKSIAGDTNGLRHGSVLVLLPGANGEHIPTPLVGKSLGETEIPLRSISRAIELYLSYNGDQAHPSTQEIKKLKEMTGFDVSNEKGLRNFINQYFTHTQRFDDTAMQQQGGQAKFLFNVWDKIEGKEGKAWIKAGMTGSGDRPMMAGLDSNGKLNQAFQDILKEGLATRTKAVVYTREGLRGINERIDKDRPFTDVHYRTDGRWQPTHYANYNEYVKAFSKTTAYGKNKIGDDYVYTANPSIAYNVDSLENRVEVKPNERAANIEVPAPRGEYDESLATELDDIFNAMPRTERKPVKEIGTAPENSKPLDMKNLEDLYTFTPEDQRNGKVPADVYRELQDRGHTFLPKGYNPFSLCL